MQWSDEALVLGCRKHGESGVILEVLTVSRGRHLGMVRGGRSRRLSAALQPGNSLQVTWSARLADHLGSFTVEPVTQRAASLMSSAVGTYGIQLLAAYVRLLPEREPHPQFANAVLVSLNHLTDPHIAGPVLVRMEAALLQELGYRLDLETCAATGDTENLTFVSPKSGRAVSEAAAQPYRDRLLPLPAFLAASGSGEADLADVIAGFRLTGYFMHKHIFDPLGIDEPAPRAGFLTALERQWNLLESGE